jgi:ATP-dependent DNA helicase RecQ
VVSQKALSCVYRSGQLFGVSHLIDILLGKSTEKTLKFDHQNLSTFAIGQELNQAQWRSVYRQLIALGLLHADMNNYGSLKLTDKSRDVLKGKQKISLRKDIKHQKNTKNTRKHSYKGQLAENNKELWEALRNCRSEIAKQYDIAPFMVFHDATLMDMINQLPQDRQQFSQISGVGQHKLENYADQFLTILTNPELSKPKSTNIKQIHGQLSDTIAETLFLFKSNKTIEKIAEIREVSQNTIISHLAQAIIADELELADIIEQLNISDEDITLIHHYWQEIDQSESRPLSALKELLDEQYSYSILKVVTASFV